MKKIIVKVTREKIEKEVKLDEKTGKYWHDGILSRASFGNPGLILDSMIIRNIITKTGLPHKNNFNPIDMVGTYELDKVGMDYYVNMKFQKI